MKTSSTKFRDSLTECNGLFSFLDSVWWFVKIDNNGLASRQNYSHVFVWRRSDFINQLELVDKSQGFFPGLCQRPESQLNE